MKKTMLFCAAMTMLSSYAATPADSVDGRYYRLFAPTTFYHSVADRQLNISGNDADDTSAAIDQALLNVYLHRPDLVEVTEAEQQESGTLRQDIIDLGAFASPTKEIQRDREGAHGVQPCTRDDYGKHAQPGFIACILPDRPGILA